MNTVDLSAAPSTDLFTRARFWGYYVLRHYMGAKHGEYGPEKWQGTLKGLEDSMLEQAKKGEEVTESEVPRYSASELTPEKFQEIFLKSNTPVVIDGLATEWDACKEWSPAWFADRYGDYSIPVRSKGDAIDETSLQIVDMTLKELVGNIDQGGKWFGANMADIFNNNPELRAALDLDVLSEYGVSNKKSKIGSTQLFLSGPGTRSGFHCTGGINLFVMVYGHKEWTFVAPEHSRFMYPITRKDMFYAASPIDWKKPYDEIEADGHPLYRYVPKFVANLKAGDVLFSPQWWWHAVDTTTPGIGVATRAMNEFMIGNKVFASMWCSSKEFRQLVFEILKHGWGSDAKSGARLAFEQDFVDKTTA